LTLVDLAFGGFVALGALRGFYRGLIAEALDLFGFVIGAVLALRFYPVAGRLFEFFGLGVGWSDVLGGLSIFLLFVLGAGFLGRLARTFLPSGLFFGLPLKVGGAIFAAAWAALIAIFLLIVATVVPAPSGVQEAIRTSLVGRVVLQPASPVYTALEGFAKRDARNLLFYVRQYLARLEPQMIRQQEECFTLRPSGDLTLDPGAEQAIFDLVNTERSKNGLGELSVHLEVREVARAHSADMYQRGYFCHVNPDGEDPFDRMAERGVRFTHAAENLALAPSVQMAHQGLMNSPSHRANILEREFTDVGVGVYEGPYGLMVTQNFCAGCRS
jgi:uncharacterized protein YkwD/uncharacterized membrane protein required for colicin V production